MVDRRQILLLRQGPVSIVVLSNADDKVVSTSGEDDRFEIVPQVFVNADGDEYDDSDLATIGIDTAGKTEAEVDTLVAETLRVLVKM